MLKVSKQIFATFLIGFGISVLFHIVLKFISLLSPLTEIYSVQDFESIKSVTNLQFDDFLLKKRHRILCWIETNPKNHRSKDIHIWNTWGKRCDKTIFITTEEDRVGDLEFVKVNTTEGYYYLWPKTIAGLKYLYENYLNQYDWFFKADDDTYLIVENLRYLLQPFSSSELLAFGGHLGDLYLSGGAGYVMSRAALQRINENGFNNLNLCRTNSLHSPEDTSVSACLSNVGVKLIDTRDNFGRIRFHIERPEVFLTIKNHTNWWFHHQYPYTYMQGFDCCSDMAISFHYITPLKMYLYDALLYKIWPWGIQYSWSELI